MENLKERIKTLIKQASLYSIILITFVVGISIGYYYDMIKNSISRNKPQSVKRSEVSLALDENNHLIIIKKDDGTYTTYQDSIGYMVFNLYAKSIWGHATNQKNVSDGK
jgi:hypothetical protein